MNSVSIFGLQVDCFTAESLNNRIRQAVMDAEHVLISHINVHGLNIAAREPRFKQTLNASDYLFCDGHGVMLAARFLGCHIPEKITYADWLPKLARYCAEHSLSVFLLGGKPGIAEEAAQQLKASTEALDIVGVHHGYFEMATDSAPNREVVRKINEARPHILLVCLGMPCQEYWLQENWAQLQANVALTGGAALDYMAGALKRPPNWMTHHGLEWLGRLLIEPRRLWQRYTIGNIIFVLRLTREWLRLRSP